MSQINIFDEITVDGFCGGGGWSTGFELALGRPVDIGINHNRFISVEGYKAFRGTMRITPKAAVPAFDLHGDWLYKPETGCWYGKGSSFPEDICTIVEVM